MPLRTASDVVSRLPFTTQKEENGSGHLPSFSQSFDFDANCFFRKDFGNFTQKDELGTLLDNELMND